MRKIFSAKVFFSIKGFCGYSRVILLHSVLRPSRLLSIFLTCIFLLPIPAYATTWNVSDTLTDIPGAFLQQNLTWSSCDPDDSHFLCAWMNVPLDWYHPLNGRRMKIRVSQEIPHSVNHNKPLMFTAAGGPGGSGLKLPELVMEDYPELSQEYRIISFDSRGIGQSGQLQCTDQNYLNWINSGDDSDNSLKSIKLHLRKSRFFAWACMTKYHDILPYISTTQVAADMNLLRALLHARHITYEGASYATDLGSTYATLFPGRVNRLVLDSVIHGFNDMQANIHDWGSSFSRRFYHDFVPWLAHNDASYHWGDSVHTVLARWKALRHHLVEQPYHQGTLMIDGNFVDALSVIAMYNKKNFSGLAQDLYNLAHWTSISARQQQITVDRSQALYDPQFISSFSAYSCNDKPWNRDVRQIARDLIHQANSNALANASQLFWSGVCAYWPHYSHPVVTVTAKDFPPFLMLSALYDPATPYPDTYYLHSIVPQSSLVTVIGGDHGQMWPPTPCIQSIIMNYLHYRHIPRDAVCTK